MREYNVKIDPEFADNIAIEAMKESLENCASLMAKFFQKLAHEPYMDEYEFEDAVDTIEAFSNIYNTLKFYTVCGEAKEMAKEALGHEN